MVDMATRWPQDDPEMVPRWPQGDHKIVLSCKRGANFAKLAMPSSVRSPKGPKVAPRRPKDEPRWSRDHPRWPENASIRFQDDAKVDSRGHKLRRGKQQIVLSCGRNAIFAKSAMQRPSSEVVTLKWRKQNQDCTTCTMTRAHLRQ